MANFFPYGPSIQVDTLVVQAAPVGLDRWAAISIIAIAIFLIFAVVALTFALMEARRLTKKISEAVGRIEPGVHPVLERARGVTENVEKITEIVRKDVDRVTDSVQAVTGRLNQAAARMEERIEEFNAVVEVVQSEAEGIFLDTAATARGVRAGALSLSTGSASAAVSGEAVGADSAGDARPPSEVARERNGEPSSDHAPSSGAATTHAPNDVEAGADE